MLVVILVNAVFSYVQEHRAEQAVAALRANLWISTAIDPEAVTHHKVDVVSA